MSNPARARGTQRRQLLPWAVLSIVVVGILLLPVLVASTVTTHPDDGDYLRKPWLGWTFAGHVVTDAFGANAASPGSALEQASQQFDDPITVSAVELAYIPGDSGIMMGVITDSGEVEQTVDPDRPLVWQVYGTWGDSEAEGVVGLLDFSSGLLVWDVRTDLEAAGDDNAP